MQKLIFPQLGATSPLPLVEKEEIAYHEQIKKAAELIREKNVRFVFLAGPSCSGKTTTSLSLVQALEKSGKRVLTFSTDDFFFDQEQAPKNQDGTPNYDAFEHTDSAMIAETLLLLSQGNVAQLPAFNFISGKRLEETLAVDPKDYDIFILEGIHALNDVILTSLPKKELSIGFYLDVTAVVGMEGTEHYLLPEEIRLCRRLIRDFKHRNASAERTYALWKNVRLAETEILIPFQKNAAMILNSNFSYEIPVIKRELTELLCQVAENCPFFQEAKRLLAVFSPFPTLPEALVPTGSVLKEFID